MPDYIELLETALKTIQELALEVPASEVDQEYIMSRIEVEAKKALRYLERLKD